MRTEAGGMRGGRRGQVHKLLLISPAEGRRLSWPEHAVAKSNDRLRVPVFRFLRSTRLKISSSSIGLCGG